MQFTIKPDNTIRRLFWRAHGTCAMMQPTQTVPHSRRLISNESSYDNLTGSGVT